MGATLTACPDSLQRRPIREGRPPTKLQRPTTKRTPPGAGRPGVGSVGTIAGGPAPACPRAGRGVAQSPVRITRRGDIRRMPDSSPSASPGANILLVDDRPANLLALEAILA